jgi:hypothetical protein
MGFNDLPNACNCYTIHVLIKSQQRFTSFVVEEMVANPLSLETRIAP